VSLDLDERQQAMLAEMGIAWLPGLVGAQAAAASAAARPVASPAAQAAAPGVVASPPAAVPAAARAPASAPVPLSVPAAEPAPAVRTAAPEPTLAGPVATLDWASLASTVAGCRACGLCEGRRNTVFGVGDRQAGWMVVGEAPGEQEDLRGEPFVGPAGQLLDAMLRSLGLSRSGGGVYIANVLKCRPPGNRNPEPAEVASCEPFLRRQVELVAPRIILALGRFAVQSLLRTDEPIGRLRGRVHQYQGIPLVVSYHPAYLLRNLPDKAKAWADLCLAQQVAAQAQAGSAGRPTAA